MCPDDGWAQREKMQPLPQTLNSKTREAVINVETGEIQIPHPVHLILGKGGDTPT